MSKTIKGNIPVEIKISEFESRRCSRDCQFCWKENGLYQCHLRGCEDIEKLDDVDDDKFPTADTYGFLRTDFCKKTFGNGEKTKAESESKNAQIGISHKKTQLPPRFIKLTKVTSGTHDIFYPDGPIYINPEQIVHLCSVNAVCVGVGRPAITKIVFRNQKTQNVKEFPEEIIGNIHEQKD